MTSHPPPETVIDARTAPPVGPWYSQVNATQWRAFWATFLGWVLDGFDFTILTFILIDIQNSFTVDRALAGALGTVTLLMRFVGGAIAGTAADRWGRRLPLMISILWFSLFAGLSGFSTSYAMLFAFRALFGIGMGGEWAAGMPLVLEHWPAHLRGIASGLLQGGYSWGFILSALVFTYLYPMLTPYGEIAWRAMFWIGILPALLVLWIRRNVEESPVWLERQRHLQTSRTEGRGLAGPDLQARSAADDAADVAADRQLHVLVLLDHVLVRDVPARAGPLDAPVPRRVQPRRHRRRCRLGRVSEGRPGRRGAATIAALASLAAVPFYLFATTSALLLLGALLMGFFGAGMWGVVPTYLSERFPTAVRGVGSGFSYHAGAALGRAHAFRGRCAAGRGLDAAERDGRLHRRHRCCSSP